MTESGKPAEQGEVARLRATLRARERQRVLRRWLRPGIGIKRWLLVALIGQILIALAAALLLKPLLAGPAPADGSLDLARLPRRSSS